MTHKHHIVPKHMGGTDDPSNLVELTIEEHAQAHKKLFKQYGKIEDRLAYEGLLGMVGKEEIMKQLMSQPLTEDHKEKLRKPKSSTKNYYGNTNAKSLKGKAKSEEHKKNISKGKRGKRVPALIGNTNAKSLKGKPKSKEHIEAVSMALKSSSVREKRSKTWSDKIEMVCPYCGKSGRHNMKRYHFENCKNR